MAQEESRFQVVAAGLGNMTQLRFIITEIQLSLKKQEQAKILLVKEPKRSAILVDELMSRVNFMMQGGQAEMDLDADLMERLSMAGKDEDDDDGDFNDNERALPAATIPNRRLMRLRKGKGVLRS
jgi:hypothetical protein